MLHFNVLLVKRFWQWRSHLAGVIQASGVARTQHVGGNSASRQHVGDAALFGPQANVTSLDTLGVLCCNCAENVSVSHLFNQKTYPALCWSLEWVINCCHEKLQTAVNRGGCLLTFRVLPIAWDLTLSPFRQLQITFRQTRGKNLRRVYSTDAYVRFQLQESCKWKETKGKSGSCHGKMMDLDWGMIFWLNKNAVHFSFRIITVCGKN